MIYEKKVWIKIKISARFRPIFDLELKGKRSRAEPSWKSFSSSQLGSDPSLRNRYIIYYNIFLLEFYIEFNRNSEWNSGQKSRWLGLLLLYELTCWVISIKNCITGDFNTSFFKDLINSSPILYVILNFQIVNNIWFSQFCIGNSLFNRESSWMKC